MKTIKPMKGSELEAWFRKHRAEKLADAFEGHVFELYDHKDIDTAGGRLDMLDGIDKKWRGKKCSVVTIVLR
jgi:hypothetical protein